MSYIAEDITAPAVVTTVIAHTSHVKTPEELAGIVSRFAASGGWLDRVRFRAGHRWFERLYHGPDHDIWAISWLPGQSTGFHDHGSSAGAFAVASGVLQEHRPGEQSLAIVPGEVRSFGPDYAHDVRNESLAPAISIHAYSPPLTDMNEYELDHGELVPLEHGAKRAETSASGWDERRAPQAENNGPAGIDQMLAAARARLDRLAPQDAYAQASSAGALLVDIRPAAQRASEGSIPGALVVERNVLEWRFDPTSSAKLDAATDHNVQVIVFCSEGYTSSLAAAALQELGLWRATDVIGGFQAWRAAGLPASLPTSPRSGEQHPDTSSSRHAQQAILRHWRRHYESH